MATAVLTKTTIVEGKVIKFTWPLTSANTAGAPIPAMYAEYSDRTVHFTGTWGGATAAWEGGDGTTYLACADAQGTAITRTSDSGMERVVECPEYSRPNLTTAGTNAVITATCIARKP